jgi:site-specific recombinase XerD
MVLPHSNRVDGHHAHAGDLFDSQREDWRTDPRAAFDAWLAQQDFRLSSAGVYRAQWGLFLDWLAARRETIMTVDAASIASFVAGLAIRKPQRARYLRLIERVLDHVRAIELASTNPARFIAQDGEAAWRDAHDNEPTGFLTAGERAALIAQLFSSLGQTSAAQRWRVRRDRALVALFLGAGIKTGEARSLTVQAVCAGSAWLTVEAVNPAFTRRTRLSPFAIATLDAWLDERRGAGLSGELLFPASPSGRPMHKATMLRCVDALIDAAGIAQARPARASPQTLRNTFAAEQFEAGVDPEQVGQWLGLVRPISAHRLHRAWKNWATQPVNQADVAPALAEKESGSGQSDER